MSKVHTSAISALTCKSVAAKLHSSAADALMRLGWTKDSGSTSNLTKASTAHGPIKRATTGSIPSAFINSTWGLQTTIPHEQVLRGYRCPSPSVRTAKYAWNENWRTHECLSMLDWPYIQQLIHRCAGLSVRGVTFRITTTSEHHKYLISIPQHANKITGDNTNSWHFNRTIHWSIA